MKMTRLLVIFLVCAVSTFSINAFAAGRSATAGAAGGYGGLNTIIAADLPALSAEEEDGLLYMYEEEKVARDAYLEMYRIWNHWVFDYISDSEQKHMDAVANLLDAYSMDIPVDGTVAGVFNSTEMQALYEQLVEQGTVSLIEALKVGALIEDMDIVDLQERIAATENVALQRTYQNLMKGSRNHLRSFIYQLSLYGEEYVPFYLTQEEFDAIINSDRERGMYDENGEPVTGPSGNRYGTAE